MNTEPGLYCNQQQRVCDHAKSTDTCGENLIESIVFIGHHNAAENPIFISI